MYLSAFVIFMSIECGNAALFRDVQIGREWVEGNKFNTSCIRTDLTYIIKHNKPSFCEPRKEPPFYYRRGWALVNNVNKENRWKVIQRQLKLVKIAFKTKEAIANILHTLRKLVCQQSKIRKKLSLFSDNLL